MNAPHPTSLWILGDADRRRPRDWLRDALLVLGLASAIALGLVLTSSAPRSAWGRYWAVSLLIGLCSWACAESLMRLAVRSWYWRLHRWGRAPSRRERWVQVAVCLLLGAVAGSYLGQGLALAATGRLDWARFTAQLPQMLPLVLGVSLAVAGVLLLTLWLASRIATAEGRAARAAQQAAEARLKLLEVQLEPHMLFNTLANLRALVAVDAGRTQTMLDHLIAYLRATLAASRSTSHTTAHTLADEFARLADYLALMQIRMGERLRVTLDLPPPLAALPLPPLLLQPLVENAIRHGVETHPGGGQVSVNARQDGAQLVLTVTNDGHGLRPGHSHGFGLAQVRERLATLHGARAALSLTPREGGGTIARITLPCPQP